MDTYKHPVGFHILVRPEEFLEELRVRLVEIGARRSPRDMRYGLADLIGALAKDGDLGLAVLGSVLDSQEGPERDDLKLQAPELTLGPGDTVTVQTMDGEPVGFEVRRALQLRSPPREARCRCCNRRLTDVQSIGAGEGRLCREGLCKAKAGRR